MVNTQAVDGQRLEFNAGFLACQNHGGKNNADAFARGYDDARCGRNHAHINATVAGDAYRKGWMLGESHR